MIRSRAGDDRAAACGSRTSSGRWDEYVRAARTRAAYLARPSAPTAAAPRRRTCSRTCPSSSCGSAPAPSTGADDRRHQPDAPRRRARARHHATPTASSSSPKRATSRLLDGLDLGVAHDRVLVVDDPESTPRARAVRGRAAPRRATSTATRHLHSCCSPRARPARRRRVVALAGPTVPQQLGACRRRCGARTRTTSATWRCRCSTRTRSSPAGLPVADQRRHARAAPAGSRRRASCPTSASYGVTYFNYVGKPLSYILATPEQPDDADNTLRSVFGNEAADRDIDRFAERFGCQVIDSYGSTEGGATVSRVARHAEGLARACARRAPSSSTPRPRRSARRREFDDDGPAAQPRRVHRRDRQQDGRAGFEGYYKNDEAERGSACATAGTGPATSATATSDGWFYFAGRDFEWLRVDGENFAAAPIERILARYPDVVLAAVYAVPDAEVGDQVMAALSSRPGTAFDAGGLRRRSSPSRRDLGTKWSPRYVRDHRASCRSPRARRCSSGSCGGSGGRPTSPCAGGPRRASRSRALTDADGAALRAEFEIAGTHRSARRGVSAADPIARHVTSRPEHAAIICNDVVCPYAELDENANRLARVLASRPRGARRATSR